MVSANFTPVASAIGGAILGLAVSIFFLYTGRSIGMSGIISGLVPSAAGKLPSKINLLYKLPFVSGMFHVVLLTSIFVPSWISAGTTSLSTAGTIIAGLLVGFGTRLGGGCTSGHGLCGLPRLSIRSISATLIFMTSGIATSTIILSNGFMASSPAMLPPTPNFSYYVAGVGVVMLAAAFPVDKTKWRDVIVSYVVGALFGAGLVVSGMANRDKVVQFLNISEAWDPSLAFVLGTGVAILAVVFYLLPANLKNPVLDEVGACRDHVDCYTFYIPASQTITLQLVLGSWMFGIGWGLGGLCPGPAVLLLAAGYPVAMIFCAAMVVGMSFGMGAVTCIERSLASRAQAVRTDSNSSSCQDHAAARTLTDVAVNEITAPKTADADSGDPVVPL